MSTTPVQTILVALELSDHDEPVLDTAKAYARAFGAQLVLLHVVAPEPDFVGLPKHGEAVTPRAPDEPEVGYAYDRARKAQRARKEHNEIEWLRAEIEAAGLQATALLVEGAYADKIVQEAKRLGAGLIMLGSHQRSTVGEWLLGSTSRDVLRQAPCPVLVVPRAAAEA